MLFQDKIVGSDANGFYSGIVNVSTALGWDPDWLSVILYKESGFNAKAVNKQPSSVAGYDHLGNLVKAKGKSDSNSGFVRAKYRATGILQWMPRTAYSLGIRNQQLYYLTRTQQLTYVFLYLDQFKQATSIYEAYLSVFYPAAIGKPDSYIFPSIVYTFNPGLDFDKNRDVSMRDFKRYIDNKLPAGYNTGNNGGAETATAGFGNIFAAILGIGLLGSVIRNWRS